MIRRGVTAVALALLLAAVPGVAEASPSKCDPPRGSVTVGESWAQRRLDLKRAWTLSRGAGVTVAMVDSGVDLNHPQLEVAKFHDFTGTGYRDCLGHGTAVAGIIAGRYLKGVPYHGVAPDAQLIVLKQTNAESGGDVRVLARAIRRAADLKADVINVSVQAHDHPELRAAVQYARSRDAVIVAAAGNVEKEDGTPAPAYPAAYEGVLAVGSATPAGALAESSNATTPVALLGPGQQIVSTWTGKSYMSGLEGTSFAAPYVAGVAALVRARFPGLDEEAVRQRLVATADGTLGKGTGAGMVNPWQALTAILPNEEGNTPVIAPPPPSPLPADVVAKAPPVDRQAIDIASGVAVTAIFAAFLVLAARVLIPLGRRRGWRPGKSVVPVRRLDGEP
ncbi:S8 family serine peptidase [Thermostaphylospora chromogena]|uniref:Type VII secretion-associated serine protease mycosin n=1 Tax=Thermostaphylospora chromogena TaxID=35622 RepID=A0A1H1AUJ0_9ACTN|nr:S8 family serine peptidase [Thermostaphylospora chromogena]SDQ43191.1 type VII secretion-associated serine protease mycosin [Thermostaphylospora chromogena]